MVHKSGYVGWCEEHQKRLWGTRKDARAVAREHHGARKNTYPCNIFAGCYHVGGLWDEVKHGNMTREDMINAINRSGNDV